MKGEGRNGLFAVVMIRRCFVLIAAFICAAVLALALCLNIQRTPGYNGDGEMLSTEVYETFSFPYKVQDFDIILEKISAYEGPFLEDGTDDEVVDIAALHIYNGSDKLLSNVFVELFWQSGSYIFEGKNIPPNSTVLLLEKNRSVYAENTYIHCLSWCKISGGFNIQDYISVSEIGLGTITVTNLTNNAFYNVNLYHKIWLTPPDIYVGGITYHTIISRLLPNETITLKPYHYAAGYSKIVFVTVD